MSELSELGFSAQQCRTAPGLLLPVHTTDGSNGLYIFRPDEPRRTFDKRKQKEKVNKYEMPKGARIRLDCSPVCQAKLANPAITLWVTEGPKKGDALASRGLCAVAILGVWLFLGGNDYGGVTWLADWDYVALKGRVVNIVFDSDVMTKRSVRQALERLTEHLQRKGATVNAVYLPSDDGQKVGVDDYLLTHTVEDLEGLIDAPRPTPKAAPAQIELLDETPALITRPCALLNGRAHVAIWPYIRKTETESLNKAGEIVRYSDPMVSHGRPLMIVREDGVIFGEGGTESLEKLGANVHLPEIPPSDKLWSTPGIKRWLSGNKPSADDLFERIVAVIDCFIDFDKSLTDQRGMCELVACYILATWFLDAFSVIGFVWPNGERGSGKTQLLIIIAALAYLGQVILAGGSFAALRDLADYGAFLGFDDAENLSDPRKTDPDKRALLLAGNRKGNTIPLKEPRPDGTWGTRYVNTFCPRGFSAIRLPDAVLASRTIIIPLIRSGDRRRSNADPLDYEIWPNNRRDLIDDLWALALSNLSKLSAYERRVNETSELTGRTLEPWRAVLAVAYWLNDQGVTGIAERMQKLSVAYQSERQEMETGDLTTLVIRALCDPAISAICAISAIKKETPQSVLVTTAQIVDVAKRLAEEDESGVDSEIINSKRVGRILAKLRLEKGGRVDGKGARQWIITTADVLRWREVYKIAVSSDETPPYQNGGNGENGETAEPERHLSEMLADLTNNNRTKRVRL